MPTLKKLYLLALHASVALALLACEESPPASGPSNQGALVPSDNPFARSPGKTSGSDGGGDEHTVHFKGPFITDIEFVQHPGGSAERIPEFEFVALGRLIAGLRTEDAYSVVDSLLFHSGRFYYGYTLVAPSDRRVWNEIDSCFDRFSDSELAELVVASAPRAADGYAWAYVRLAEMKAYVFNNIDIRLLEDEQLRTRHARLVELLAALEAPLPEEQPEPMQELPCWQFMADEDGNPTLEQMPAGEPGSQIWGPTRVTVE